MRRLWAQQLQLPPPLGFKASMTYLCSYSSLQERCHKCGNILCHLSRRAQDYLPAPFCAAGDAVAINMPMTVHAVVIYLGIIYAGCTAVSIADSFAPSEISTRLQIAQTKAIFVQDVVLRGSRAHPLYQRVVQAQGPRAIVLPASRAQGLQVSIVSYGAVRLLSSQLHNLSICLPCAVRDSK